MKKFSFKNILFLFIFMMFFVNFDAILTDNFTIKNDDMIKFINTVRYVEYQDSLKTNIISIQDSQITKYKLTIKIYDNKCIVDSLLLQNKLNKIKLLLKQLIVPIYKSKLAYFCYGISIMTILIILIR